MLAHIIPHVQSGSAKVCRACGSLRSGIAFIIHLIVSHSFIDVEEGKMYGALLLKLQYLDLKIAAVATAAAASYQS